MSQKPNEWHSTGQGVGGNAESEGPLAQVRLFPGLSSSEPSPASQRKGDPLYRMGKPSSANGCDVSEAGMRTLGSHGDLGKPSVSPSCIKEGVLSERSEMAKAQGAETVGTVRERSQEDQGGRRSRITDGASCNGESGKGSWLTEEDQRRPTDDARRERAAWWEATSPALCARRPLGGKVERPSGSVGNLREGGDARPHYPTRSRQRNSGNPTTTLGVADGGGQPPPPTLSGSPEKPQRWATRSERGQFSLNPD